MELAPLRELEEAAQCGWLLATENVAHLLNLRPSTVTGYGEQFDDAGFIFERQGKRKSGQIAWRVIKPGVSAPPTVDVGATPMDD